jgi:hypothetical protein
MSMVWSFSGEYGLNVHQRYHTISQLSSSGSVSLVSVLSHLGHLSGPCPGIVPTKMLYAPVSPVHATLSANLVLCVCTETLPDYSLMSFSSMEHWPTHHMVTSLSLRFVYCYNKSGSWRKLASFEDKFISSAVYQFLEPSSATCVDIVASDRLTHSVYMYLPDRVVQDLCWSSDSCLSRKFSVTEPEDPSPWSQKPDIGSYLDPFHIFIISTHFSAIHFNSVFPIYD